MLNNVFLKVSESREGSIGGPNKQSYLLTLASNKLQWHPNEYIRWTELQPIELSVGGVRWFF